MFDLNTALRRVIETDGSDLHLKVPSRPLIRRLGGLEAIPESDPLTPEDTERVLRDLLIDDDKLAEFTAEHEVDFSFSVPGLSRFRVNAFRQRGVISLVCRAVPHEIKSIESLGLPQVISEIADEERGIILLTGTTGSFKRALRRVLRQDPDVILVGEMRDEETVHTALSAAETGHLVLSTLHTVDAPETVNRIIDFFPPHQQQQARAMIAGTLKGIVSQRLVPTADGNGRIACCEILVMTGRVHDMILDPKLTGELPEVIAEGSYYGMQTFDQHLLSHLQAGRARPRRPPAAPAGRRAVEPAGAERRAGCDAVRAAACAAVRSAAGPVGS